MELLFSERSRDWELAADPEFPWIELQPLVDRCLGDISLADRLIARFKSSLATSTERIEITAAAEDLPQLEKLSHRLRGEAASLSAVAIAELAARTEELCRFRLTEEAIASVHDLIAACRRYSAQAFTLTEILAAPRG